jgi:hypothetical protein
VPEVRGDLEVREALVVRADRAAEVRVAEGLVVAEAVAVEAM